MRTLESILNVALYLLVIVVFAPIYYTMVLIDWIRGKNED